MKTPAPLPESEWAIEVLVPGGDGMTRISDGRVGFASRALPGDRIRVIAHTLHASWVRADRWELVLPGEARVPPVCPVQATCGGCEWMPLARPSQIAAKSSIIREALRRIGGLGELPGEVDTRSVGSDLGYRNRLRLHVDTLGRIGLYAPESHDLVEIPGCVVSDPAINRTLLRIRELAADEPQALARWAEIEIRAAPAGPPVSLWLVPRGLRAPSPAERALLAAFKQEWLAVERGAADGPVVDQRWSLPSGAELRSPPGGFVQVNWPVNLEMVTALLDGVKARGIRSFIELYAGAGNFALPLLLAGLTGVAIEQSAGSIRAARRSARALGVSDDAFVTGEAVRELSRRSKSRDKPDLVFLDPPRGGARETVRPLLELAPRFIAFCACDPVTLARDVKALSAAYAVDSVAGFDMFPHTHHVETLIWLRAKSG